MPYRNKDGRVMLTAQDMMMNLIDCVLEGDWSPENLPERQSTHYTKEAQALLDHAYSDAFTEGDKLFDRVEEASAAVALMSCRIAASVVYEHFVEAKEGGVAEADFGVKGDQA